MQTLGDRLLIHLIDCVYEAATDASKWGVVAEALGETFRARFSSVFGFSPSDSRVLYSQSRGMPAEFFTAYEATYAALDIRMPAALRVPAGTVVTDETLIDRAVYASSPIYNEYLRPNDCDHLMAVLPENSAGTRVIVSLNRPARVGAFDAQEREFFGRLVPHLQRAVTMSAKLVTAANAEGLSLEFMARVHFGIITLSMDGRIVDANPVAQNFLRARDSITQVDGRLMALNRPANDRLQRAIANGGRLSVSRVNSKLDPVVIPSTAGRALRLLLAPLSRTHIAVGIGKPLLVAFIFRHSEGPMIHPPTLSLVYGITPAEARVAAKLAEGCTAAEIARLFAISVDTVRTHIKHILAKTECDSQTALVREILLGPARLLSPTEW